MIKQGFRKPAIVVQIADDLAHLVQGKMGLPDGYVGTSATPSTDFNDDAIGRLLRIPGSNKKPAEAGLCLKYGQRKTRQACLRRAAPIPTRPRPSSAMVAGVGTLAVRTRKTPMS